MSKFKAQMSNKNHEAKASEPCFASQNEAQDQKSKNNLSIKSFRYSFGIGTLSFGFSERSEGI